MVCSPAKLAANRANSLLSTGPKLKKDISRRNGLKHGMTGEGIVLPGEDEAAIKQRFSKLKDELQPRSELGLVLTNRIALLSVRMERSAVVEAACLRESARVAEATFDENRHDAVERIFDQIPDDPKAAVRILRLTPEGVDRLIRGWEHMKLSLGFKCINSWFRHNWERCERLMGRVPVQDPTNRLKALSDAAQGDFWLLGEEGGELSHEDRMAWAKVEILKVIDAEVAELIEHRTTLNLEGLARSRAEAQLRSRFDDSKQMVLNRKYEASNARELYKAIETLRVVEAEAEAQAETAAANAEEAEVSDAVASSFPINERESEPTDPPPGFVEETGEIEVTSGQYGGVGGPSRPISG